MTNVTEPGVCYWCKKNCGGTCLGVNHEGGPRQMKTNDPAYWMLKDGRTSTKDIHRDGCYICEDPEFAQMGLPLCNPCPQCTAAEGESVGHIPADDEECEDCGYNRRTSRSGRRQDNDQS
jgi:hypothetical protein